MAVQEARAAWGWIRNGLLAVIEKTHERWTPEDVWSMVAANQAHVYALEVRDNDCGFFVLRLLPDFDGPALFVWAMWCEPGLFNGFDEGVGKMFLELDKLALAVKAKRIRAESPRCGWERFFDVRATIYEREVA